MERKLNIAYNGLGQFFVHIHCADGTHCEEGPFKSGEEATTALESIQNNTYWVYDGGCDD